MENWEDFVKRFSNSIGCYYHLCNSGQYWSLKKFNSDKRRSMAVFAWIRELKRKCLFEISTYKHLGDDAGVSELADEVKPGYLYVSKYSDPEGKGTCLIFYCKKGSNSEDYQKAVKALKAILSLRYNKML